MSSDGVFDKSKWPLQTPDIYWALSDGLENIGQLGAHDENFAEYEIDANELPDGSLALHNINAIRNISIDLLCFPRPLRHKLKAAALCLGRHTLEYIKLEDSTTKFNFFSGENICPLFILDDLALVVRLFFSELDSASTLLPYKCIDADGLLVRLKNTRKSFFVGASNQSILTWNGKECHIESCLARGPSFRRDKRPIKENSDVESDESSSGQTRDKLRVSPFDHVASPPTSGLIAPQAVENFANYKDLWNALPLSPKLDKSLPSVSRKLSMHNPESESEEESFKLF